MFGFALHYVCVCDIAACDSVLFAVWTGIFFVEDSVEPATKHWSKSIAAAVGDTTEALKKQSLSQIEGRKECQNNIDQIKRQKNVTIYGR